MMIPWASTNQLLTRLPEKSLKELLLPYLTLAIEAIPKEVKEKKKEGRKPLTQKTEDGPPCLG
jgi:hypothetical protein